MNLTTKSKYAVIAMTDLGLHNQNKPLALAKIAEKQYIALNYLEQIFAKLRKAKLVKAVKGPGGGYYLGKKTEEITIFDIIKAVDGPVRVVKDNKNRHNDENITHAADIVWQGLGQHIVEYLKHISLADICKNNYYSTNIDITIKGKSIIKNYGKNGEENKTIPVQPLRPANNNKNNRFGDFVNV